MKKIFCLCATIAFLWACGTPTEGQCTKDTDCKGDRVCKSGACVDTTTNNNNNNNNTGCKSAQECASGQTCSSGKCTTVTQKECNADGDCGAGKKCNSLGRCVTSTQRECNADGDCGAGKKCNSLGKCIAKTCSGDLDCDITSNEKCVSGACVVGGCQKNTDCGRKEICDGGKCIEEVGKQCQNNQDCKSNSCLLANGASFGYCTKVCTSFSQCPSFWECKRVGNATANYCVEGN